MTDDAPERSGWLRRRELLAAGAAAGIGLAGDAWAGGPLSRERKRRLLTVDFSTAPDRAAWGGTWRSIGVANLRRESGLGLLEAGSDVFPNDPRPVAFALDRRALDGEISATLARVGSAPGVVLRRRSPRHYYAAVYDTESAALRILARVGNDLHELSRASVPATQTPVRLSLRISGRAPAILVAQLSDPSGALAEARAEDSRPELQHPGDPGVLATARTLFPSDANPVVPALGNLHLLPWSVQEGQAVMATAVGAAVVNEIRNASTAAFTGITVSAKRRPRPTRPSVVAATTGVPTADGAWLHVGADVPSRVSFELSYSPDFERSWIVDAGKTGRFHAASARIDGLPGGRRVHWRARLRRRGTRSTGPARSFLVSPQAGEPVRIAVGACASQFGPAFTQLAAARPDVFVWQGDLNYPDTHGPLAQTMSGYAGIWRDFLGTPQLGPILADAAFVAQRDDHDYGVQDANSTTMAAYPWALAPWESLVNPQTFFRFPAGEAEFWVLDQRRFKSDPEISDGPEKTLLGARQRRWLLRTLATSKARFKVICSPTTVFMPANARDGNWATGFEHEGRVVLDFIRANVAGATLFLTGDTHLTGVYAADDGLEVRAAPLGIPRPNDVTLVDPLAATNLRGREGVAYAGDECHFTLLETSGRGSGARLDLSLIREDGATVYTRRLDAS